MYLVVRIGEDSQSEQLRRMIESGVESYCGLWNRYVSEPIQSEVISLPAPWLGFSMYTGSSSMHQIAETKGSAVLVEGHASSPTFSGPDGLLQAALEQDRDLEQVTLDWNGAFTLFRFASNRGSSLDRVEVLTDRLGLGRVIFAKYKDCILLSDRQLLLGLITESPIDPLYAAVLETCSGPVGDVCLFRDVKFLGAERRLVIEAGRLSIHTAVDFATCGRYGLAGVDMVGDAIEAAVQRSLAAFPDTEVTLTGGTDSRASLALMMQLKKRVSAMSVRWFRPDVDLAIKLSEIAQVSIRLVDVNDCRSVGKESDKELVAEVIAQDADLPTTLQMKDYGYHNPPGRITICGSYSEGTIRGIWMKAMFSRGTPAQRVGSLVLGRPQEIVRSSFAASPYVMATYERLGERIKGKPAEDYCRYLYLMTRGQRWAAALMRSAHETGNILDLPFACQTAAQVTMAVPPKEWGELELIRHLIYRWAPRLSRVPFVEGISAKPARSSLARVVNRAGFYFGRTKTFVLTRLGKSINRLTYTVDASPPTYPQWFDLSELACDDVFDVDQVRRTGLSGLTRMRKLKVLLVVEVGARLQELTAAGN